MSIRLAQMDVAEPLPVISGISGCSSVWVLVHDHGVPMGYVRIHGRRSKIDPKHLADEIVRELGDTLAARDLCRKLSPEPPQGSSYHPLISVLVCTRDRPGFLRHTLDSLLALDYPDYEVVVVDNAPSNDETERLVSEYPFRYAMEPHPGHSWVRNRAILESRGEIVAFMDDDMTADPLWLRATARAFEQEDVGLVTGLVLPMELETKAQEFFEISYGGFSMGFEPRVFPPGTKWHYAPCGMAVETGPHMAYRRSAFDRVGLFDVALGGHIGGGEDLDLIHRIIRAGYAIAYEPNAIRFHRHRDTIDGLRRQVHGYGRCYTAVLTKCFAREPDLRLPILKRLVEYFLDWTVKRCIRRAIRWERMPLHIILAESLGALQGPWAYLQSAMRIAQLKRENSWQPS